MPLKPFQFTKDFLADRCDECGRCFSECPVLEYPQEKAVTEIRALIQGKTSEVLERCTGCMACNSICPQDANPHALILRRWKERYEEKGLPYPAGLVLPHQKPNLYTVGHGTLPKDEKALVETWERNLHHPPPADTMIYAGCNMILQPFIMDSNIYRGIPIFGSIDLCCGEPFYRMGCRDQAKAAAENVRNAFRRMKLKNVIMPCTAGYHLFKYVYPEILDVHLDTEIIAIEDWLIEQIHNDRLQVSLLNITVALHDNCWPKASGDTLFEKVRELLRLVGVTVVEPEHTREKALCCGMCAGAARHRLRDIVNIAEIRLKELEATPSDAIVDYCGGCNWLFNLADQLAFGRYPKTRYHLLELVQWSAGENPARRGKQRARRLALSMTPHLAYRYLRNKRIWLNT
jgi:heterodisulfide reductase subunit D